MGEDRNKVLQTMHGLCVKLSREATVDNIVAVQTALEAFTEADMLQQLQQYILFPLRIIFKHSVNKSENVYITALRCQMTLFKRTKVLHAEIFCDIFTSLTIMLTSDGPSSPAPSRSEEFKLAAVECLSALNKASTASVLEQVYKPASLPMIGHAVSLLLQLVTSERLRELRLAAMVCLQDLAHLNSTDVSEEQYTVVADTFASFLPGISIAMTSVATGDSKQGHMIIQTAVLTWFRLVALVMGDSGLASDASCVTGDPDLPYMKLVVVRNKAWLSDTADKLKILISKMSSLAYHSNWRVRLVMVQWADCLLAKCSSTLHQSVGVLLEVLVGRVSDEYERVSAASREALRRYEGAGGQRSRILVDLLEENLHALAVRLPVLFRTTDDDAKHGQLSLCIGYLVLLGTRISGLLHSHVHLQHLFSALLHMFQLDCSGLNIIQEKSSAAPHFDHHVLEFEMNTQVRRMFCHFADERIERDLVQLCRLIGYYGDLELAVDYMLEKYMQSSLYRKESVLILNELILGTLALGVPIEAVKARTVDKCEMFRTIRCIVEEYLAPEHWNLQTSSCSGAREGGDLQIISTTAPTPVCLQTINSDIMQMCLQLEGLANCAKVLGEDFQPLLADVLYPILECVGDDNYSIHQTALNTLRRLAHSCKHRDVQDLLNSNADYLVNAISLRLRHLHIYPKAPLVLKVIVTQSNELILPLIKDTITEILYSLDSHYGDQTAMFLSVLRALVVSIKHWYPPPESKTSYMIDMGQHVGVRQMDGSLREYFVEYLKQRRIAEDVERDVGNDVGDDVGDVPDNTSASSTGDDHIEPPQYTLIVTQVLERCSHLLASPDPRIRLMVLDTIIECASCLKAHQDLLLPLIHKLWPAFVLRFADEEPQVIIKAFRGLQVLGEMSGSFIRQRVVKDIVPKLTMLLQKMAKSGQQAGLGYRFSVTCRLQLSVLENIGPLCSSIGLSGQHLGPVLKATLPYLSSRQHPTLQQAALETWRGFALLEPDCVWFILTMVSGTQLPPPPDEVFKPVKMPAAPQKEEFQMNVQRILEDL